jgi:hypothetical protein
MHTVKILAGGTAPGVKADGSGNFALIKQAANLYTAKFQNFYLRVKTNPHGKAH